MKAFLIIKNIEIKNQSLLFSGEKNSNKWIVPRIFQRSPSKKELDEIEWEWEVLKSISKKDLEDFDKNF